MIPVTRARLHRLAASLVDGLSAFDSRVAAYMPEDVATANRQRQERFDALIVNLEDAAHLLAMLAEGTLEVVDSAPIEPPRIMYDSSTGRMVGEIPQ